MTSYLSCCLRNRAVPVIVLAIWVAGGICVKEAMGAEGAAPAGAGQATAQKEAASAAGSPPTPVQSVPANPAPGAKPPETPPAAAKPAEPAPAKPAEAKPAEPKAPEAKPAEKKAPETKPAEAKPPEAKPAEAKGAGAKPAESKPPETKPAETKPPEPKPAETKPAEAAKPGPSYALLARPAIADRLRLSEEQRAKVAALLAERREALAKATEADHAKVLDESEKKLGGVLSEAQRADFGKIPPEPLLRFKFRFQRWVDVLEEVARQAGLSLVLDAPPPGTLNYSDDKEYTPTEAIDLLNSVLLTKGYTLIRRDRMLVCVSIEEGIPENLVPRVTLDELDYRGKFELVTVMFPLEGRAAATVAEEIKPLMSPLGKVVPLPATSQLLITDGAGNMRAIRALIKAMPVPPATAVAQPAKPEPPVFAIYAIKGVDPASVLSVMKTLYPAPASNFVLDPKTDQLSVHAGPTVQASVKAILEEMTKTGQPPEKQSRLELYPIDETRGPQIIKSLEGIAPNAKLTLDTRTGKVVAWATGADHDLLKKALEKLGMGPVPEQARQFEVYRLTKADPKSALALLEALLPSARLAVDAPTNSLVVIGTAADQKAVKSLLEQLQPEKPGPDTPELRFYQLTHTPTPGMAKVIEGLAPKAQVTIDPTNKRLMVVAPAAEHTAVKNAVEQFEKGSPPEEKGKLVAYPVTQAQRKRFQAVLKTLTAELPGIEVIADAEPGELAIWAKPEQHKVLAEILEQLKREVPAAEKYVLAAYPLTAADPTSVTTVLKSMFPTLQVVHDPKTNRLLVWALPAEQEALKKTVEQLQAQVPPDKLPRFETYPLHGAEPTALVASLQTLAPNAKFTSDTKAGRLVVWGTPTEHEVIRGAMEKLGRGTTIENTPQVETYRLTRVDPATLVPLLQSLVPEAKVSVDAHTKTLIVVAIPADQQTVRGVVQQFQPEKPGRDTPELRTYPITAADPTSVMSVLKSTFPTLQITLDPKTNRLLVWAVPSEHDALQKTLEQVQTQVPSDQLPRFETYPLHGAEPTPLVANLQTLAPNAKFAPDTKAGRLVVWGTPAEHEVIRGAMEKLGRGTTIENTPQVETYRLTRVDPATLVPLLQSLVPDAKVSVDAQTKTLIVVAIPADQQTVRGVVQQFQPEKAGRDTPDLRTYPITAADPTSVMAVLKSTFPTLQVTLDPKTNRLLVWAVPWEHDAVKKTLEQVQAPGQPEQQPRFEVYSVHGADPTTLVTQLQTLVPNAKLAADAKSGRIVAWGTPADHEGLKAALEKMVFGSTPESAPRLEVYRLTKADPKTLTPLLQTLVPDAKISVDPQTKTLIAVAVPADHLTIKTVLEQLQPEKPPPDAPQLRFYPLAQPQPATIVKVLEGLAPKAEITLEPGGKRLTVVASPADHVIVKAAIEQIQTVALLDEKARLATYTVTPGQKKRFQSVATALASELPGIQVVAESEPDELAVWAKPSQHAVIAEILEQLKQEVPAAEKYRLVAYSIKAADPQNVLTVMKTLFPNAQFVLDTRTRRLIVWTLPADQEAIKAALEKVDPGTAAEGQDKLMVYPVPDMDPATAIKMLQEQLPEVKLSADAKSGAILAWARPAEHELIARTLKQLKVEPDAEHKETLVVYPLPSGDATALVSVLKSLVPKAQVAVEAKTNNILATAVPKDHELIRAAVEQVSKRGPAGTMPEMVVHSVPSLGPSGAASIIPTLQQIFPDATFAAGADATKLVVWARPGDQEAVRKAVEELARKEPAGSAHKLVIYTIETLGRGSGRGMLSILHALFPDGSFGFGSDPNKLFVWARPADHPAIKNTIDELTKEEPAETAHRLVVFTLDKHGPSGVSGVMSVLQTMFPGVRFSAGAEPDQLVAFVRPTDEQRIQEALKTLATPEDPKKARKMVVYTLESTGPGGVTGAIGVLTLMFPEAKFSAGTEPDKVVAWARPAEHEKIKAAVEELAKKEPAEKARKVVVYTIRAANASASYYTLSLLKTMFPEAQFTLGTEHDQLVVWARPAEHADIKSTIEQISLEEAPEKAHKLVIYTLETTGRAGMSGAISLLTTMFPEARFTPGSEPDTVAVWARPPDHKKIEAAVKELSGKEPLEKARRMVVYTLETTGRRGANGALRILSTMFPDVTFAAGTEPHKVVAWARPAEHEKIKAAVEELAKEEPAETAHRLVIYTLETTGTAGMSGAIGILTSMFPEAKFTPGSEPDKVAVWARPADHKKIEAAVKELSSKEPPEKAHQMVVYALETRGKAGASGAISILSTMFPDAKFAAGTEPNKVVAWARPAEHEKIKAAVDELAKEEPPEKARRVVVYTLESTGTAGVSGAIGILTAMFPEATFSEGAGPDQVAALARPADHERIKAAVAELSKKELPDKARKIVVYPFKSASPRASYYTLSVLHAMFPDGQFSIGADPDKLVVWARPAEHAAIKSTVEQLSQEDPPERAFKLVAYTLESTGPAATRAAITLLGQMFPDAHFTPGSEAGKVLAWARPDDHVKIKSAVEELSKQEPPEKAAQAAVYQLNSMSAKEAIPFLTTAFPEAQFSAGSEPHALIVWARPADQKQIKAAVEKIDVEGASQLQRSVAVYALKAGDAQTLQKLLDPITRRNVEIVADSARQRLIVWADPKQQEAVGKTIEEFQKASAKIGEPSTQVYRFQWADPEAAESVLTALVPAAQIALDTATHSLVATATPEDHAKIQAAIDQMDRRDADGQAPRLQVHRVTTADPSHLLTVLRGLFRARRDVQLSLDEQNDAIVAVASPAQHETIRNLIDQLEKEAKADSAVRLVLYPLKDADPDAALQVLSQLFEKQGAKVRLSVEPRDNQLVAIARPEQHAAIEKALEQLRGEERLLEILTLEVVDPWSAQMAIDRLFSDGVFPSAHAPAVDVDPATQQLFVRATKEQMTKIRDLLVKLGETGLAAGLGNDARRLRTVPFDGDLSAALDEIQRVWPQLRKNPIQVVKPAGDIPVQGRSLKLQQPGVSKPIQPAAGPKGQDAQPLPRNEAKPPATPPPDATRPVSAAPQRPAALEKAPAAVGWRASKATAEAPEAAKPVVVVPGEGSVTITSDDPAALDQFEELLRALSRQRGLVGRNFTVFLLRNAKATEIAPTLQRLFRTMPGVWRGTAGSVVLVPDERLNAIVAYASRADRATIESLLKILDTSEVPESLSADRLHLIRVKNTGAARIERMLRDLFRNHADAFSVEETTNSVVVMATGQLVDEITRVVTMLDEAAGSETSRNVAIIPLKKANAERVEKALDVILKGGPQGGTRGSTPRRRR